MKSKEWTLMFYFASDNPLASTVVSQLKAIKDAGYHPDANVIAHFDPHDSNTPVHVFDVNHACKFWYPNQSEVGFASNNPFIRDLVLDRLWGEGSEAIRQTVIEHVTAKPQWIPPGATFDPPKPTRLMATEQNPREALASFLNFCRESYPARHYLLFILGHGQVVGKDTLLFDDHAEKKSLSLSELGDVLRSFNCDAHNDKEPGALEMITLHSCSMSAMEVAYELKGSANYLMASQGPTYVGNLPYKQILIRVFNDLNAKIAPQDINGNHAGGRNGIQSFLNKLIKPSDPVSKLVREKLTQQTVEALGQYKGEKQPESKLVDLLLKDLNKFIERDDADEELLEAISGNGHSKDNGPRLVGAVNRRRSNRFLLADVFPEISRYPKQKISTMLKKMFYYCLYNSYDFQLAGYPFDLCLTNLTRVSETEDPLNELSDSLIKGLQSKNPLIKQLILLAHWDAQSFYQEDYVDLYDFCFCLSNRSRELGKEETTTVPILGDILKACKGMMDALEKGDDKMTTCAAFSGAAFQYSHGHSIYFPWTKPTGSTLWDELYAEYRLSRKTRWRNFLDVYFKETMRQNRVDELMKAGRHQPVKLPIENSLLALVGQIGAHVFAGDGALEKPGPDHPMGKYGPDDPFGGGGGCTCPSIKNYPPSVKLMDDFFQGVDMMMNGNGS